MDARPEPMVWKRTRWILQVKDYGVRRLIGTIFSEPSSWRGPVCLREGSLVPERLIYLGSVILARV